MRHFRKKRIQDVSYHVRGVEIRYESFVTRHGPAKVGRHVQQPQRTEILHDVEAVIGEGGSLQPRGYVVAEIHARGHVLVQPITPDGMEIDTTII